MMTINFSFWFATNKQQLPLFGLQIVANVLIIAEMLANYLKSVHLNPNTIPPTPRPWRQIPLLHLGISAAPFGGCNNGNWLCASLHFVVAAGGWQCSLNVCVCVCVVLQLGPTSPSPSHCSAPSATPKRTLVVS